MRILIAIVVILALLVAWSKEVVEFGAARREGRLTRESYLRFRRRSLGLFLTLCIFAMIFWAEAAARSFDLDAHGRLYWYGVAFALVLWLLIVAVRDLRATVLAAMADNRKISVESLEAVERAIRERRADRTPIPTPHFERNTPPTNVAPGTSPTPPQKHRRRKS